MLAHLLTWKPKTITGLCTLNVTSIRALNGISAIPSTADAPKSRKAP